MADLARGLFRDRLRGELKKKLDRVRFREIRTGLAKLEQYGSVRILDFVAAEEAKNAQETGNTF
jgi:hypothetical protein